MFLNQFEECLFFDEADLQVMFNNVWDEILQRKNENNGAGYAHVSMSLGELLESFRHAAYKVIAKMTCEQIGVTLNLHK
jgi:hypothetical protein